MRIRLTNDDGIHAPGLAVLEEIAAQLSDDVYVVAPETDQSGVSHSLSLNNPLRLREISPRRFAVSGTPTDCVLMAVRHVLLKKKPDLILSGVNRGQNIAEDVTYSGTIAGAMEGTLMGIPSIALSQAYGAEHGRKNLHWSCAHEHCAPLIKRVLDAGIAAGTLVNINFPDCLPSHVVGTAVVRQGRRDSELMRIEERMDGRGNPYYWLMFTRGKHTVEEGTDQAALHAHKIAITPLCLDLTDKAQMAAYQDRLTGNF